LIFLDRLQITDTPLAPQDALDAVLATHEALADLALPVPDFDTGLATAHALFDDPARTATLPTEERRFCSAVGTLLRERLDELTWRRRVLHGDPWIGGNLVNTVHGPRLIDFEAVCRGPIEWDLSSFVEHERDDVDTNLLAVCRLFRSFAVAAWCWAQPGRAPDVDEAALWHLHLLHSAFDQ
jgi:hypothetical protein